MKFLSQLTSNSQKTPISAHPVFSPVVALWFAAFLGFGALIVPVILYEKIFSVTGISSIISATSAPLGMTARLLIAFVSAIAGAALGFFLARKVGKAQSETQGAGVQGAKPNRIKKRKLSTPLSESIKRPISAREELGSISLDEPVNADNFDRAEPAEAEPPRQRRRALSLTSESEQSSHYGSVPLPGDGSHSQAPAANAATDDAPNDGPSIPSFADDQYDPSSPIQAPDASEASPLEEFRAPEFSGPTPAYNHISSDAGDDAQIPEAQMPGIEMEPNPSPDSAPFMHEEQAEMSDSHSASNETYNPFSSHAANPQSVRTPFSPPPLEDDMPVQTASMQPQTHEAPISAQPMPAEHLPQQPLSEMPPLFGQENVAETPNDSEATHDIFSTLKATIKAESDAGDEAVLDTASEAAPADVTEELAPFAPTQAPAEPTAAPTQAPAEAPTDALKDMLKNMSTDTSGHAAANELRSRSLDDLGMVELVERFAVALSSAEQDQSSADETVAPAPLAAQTQASAQASAQTSAQASAQAPFSEAEPAEIAAPFAQTPEVTPQSIPAVSADEQAEPAKIFSRTPQEDHSEITPPARQAFIPDAISAAQDEQNQEAVGYNPLSDQSAPQDASPLPAFLQPLGFDEDDFESDDANSDIDGLVLDLGNHVEDETAQPASYVPALGQNLDQTNDQPNEPINEQVAQQADELNQQADEETTEEAYSSLLAMKNSFSDGKPFPRIEEESQEYPDHPEPVVVFPGQTQRRAAPAADGPVRDPMPQAAEDLSNRPFDGPDQSAVQPAWVENAAIDPAAIQRDTERSLREALEKLQGMGGAS